MKENKIEIFTNTEFGSVRTFIINNEPYFIGKDICEKFGDKNHNRSLSRVDEIDKTLIEVTDSLGRKQRAIAINESGLYSLLFAMQPQKANNGGVSDAYPIEVQERINKLHRFKRWVTSEILPSIRKHGAYMTPETLEQAIYNPDFLIKLATELKTEKEKRQALEVQAEENKPKVLFADAVSTSQTSILVGDLAKIIKQNGVDIGANRLFAWFRDNGYLIKRKGSDYNMPTQYSMELGLFEVKETVITHSDGHTSISKTPKVTGKGQQYFVNKFLDKEGN